MATRSFTQFILAAEHAKKLAITQGVQVLLRRSGGGFTLEYMPPEKPPTPPASTGDPHDDFYLNEYHQTNHLVMEGSGCSRTAPVFVGEYEDAEPDYYPLD